MEKNKTALITGSSGFIGFSVAKKLLNDGWSVVGIDSMSDYYDVSLKEKRELILSKFSNYSFTKGSIEEKDLLLSIFKSYQPDIVIHLAAQAGVRYSIDNPRIYLESNIIGTFELLEAARKYPPKHMLLASTSSAYGANENMPYKEIHKADHQMSFYAATKKSTESMGHSYAHLFDIPITMFRFFTVYGPWGRPDMALFKFTKSILDGNPIDVYNYGDMKRDFTYIDDLVNSIELLIKTPPTKLDNQNSNIDSISPVAPFRLINIGNSQAVNLNDFIKAIEDSLGKKAIRNLMPMQDGDVPATWADTSLLEEITSYKPKTNIKDGVNNFISWYKEFYKV